LVVAVEAAAVVVRFGAQFVDGAADLRRGVAISGQIRPQQLFLDVAVVVAVGPISEVAIAQFVAEQGNTRFCVARSGFPISLISIASSP
jgi:hypothetical protein